mmetsp:Transcript_15702/g.33577  ORF Transcript_15702/g.33577 Transcript_15702/m.33577 type:complete len:116 (-) Transcript_15702:448-795(-)
MLLHSVNLTTSHTEVIRFLAPSNVAVENSLSVHSNAAARLSLHLPTASLLWQQLIAAPSQTPLSVIPSIFHQTEMDTDAPIFHVPFPSPLSVIPYSLSPFLALLLSFLHPSLLTF